MTELLLRRIAELEQQLAQANARNAIYAKYVYGWRGKVREWSRQETELKRCQLRIDVLVTTANRLASEVVQARGLTGKEATSFIDHWGDE